MILENPAKHVICCSAKVKSYKYLKEFASYKTISECVASVKKFLKKSSKISSIVKD